MEDFIKLASLERGTHEKLRNSLIRRLLCRLIDAEEEWPYHYGFTEVSTWLQDFIDGDGNYCLDFKFKNKVFTLSVTDYFNDHANTTTLNIPTFLLEDDWREQIQKHKKHLSLKRINEDIQELENILAKGPARLCELKEKKCTLEAELKN